MLVGQRVVGVGLDPSKVLNCLELSHNPAIGTGRHQHHVVHNRVLAVDRFAPIQHLIVIFGRVVKFDHVAFGRIEDRVDFMRLILITRGDAALSLRAHLVLERSVGVACKKSVQRVR